jgi:hypothetical protein
MPQFSVADADKLSSEHAAGLIDVLELQAWWKNHCDDPAMTTSFPFDLKERQDRFDAFQEALKANRAKYRHTRLPEPSRRLSDQLAVWCRVLRALFRRADVRYPVQLMANVYRMAAKTAVRSAKEPLLRESATDLAGAIRELDAVITWCDGHC